MCRDQTFIVSQPGLRSPSSRSHDRRVGDVNRSAAGSWGHELPHRKAGANDAGRLSLGQAVGEHQLLVARRRPAAEVLVDSARCIGALKKEVDSWKGSRSLFREN
jgi:hypothetical protein